MCLVYSLKGVISLLYGSIFMFSLFPHTQATTIQRILAIKDKNTYGNGFVHEQEESVVSLYHVLLFLPSVIEIH